MKTPNKSLALVTLLLIMTHGASSTLAQSVKTARFGKPEGLALDSKGNIYVADSVHGQIRKITPDGSVSTFAGVGSPNGGLKDEHWTKDWHWNPHYIAVDSADNLYVTQYDGTKIYKVTSAGVVSILTNEPKGTFGIAADRGGNIYFVDQLGSHQMIRKITSDGVVATLAGDSPEGSVDGTGSAARFQSPRGVALDSANNVYVTDGYTIRKITPAGVVTTIAGASRMSRPVDGSGSAARFGDLSNIAVDGADNLYVTDQYTVRKVTREGVVSTVAGKYEGGYGSKDGIKDAAQFMRLSGIAVDKAGNIYVADENAVVIRKITAAGLVSTLAGKVGITDEEQER